MALLANRSRSAIGLRGLAAVAFGVLALAWPGITLLVLLLLFGIYALVDGAIAIFHAILHRKGMHDRWLVLLLGIVSVIVGVAVMTLPPLMTALVLLLVIGLRAIIAGGLEIAAG